MGEVHVGLNSNLNKNKTQHFIMLDYDRLPHDLIMNDIEQLQDKFNLPAAYVFESSPSKKFKGYRDKQVSYHVYIFDRVSLTKLIQVVFASSVDEKFKKCILYNNYATLRLTAKKGNKIKYLMKIPGESENEDAESKDGVMTWLYSQKFT